jgi:hypothetical protein
MAKKCDTVWGGIRDAYNVREAFQVIETLRRSGGRVVGEVGEMVMMVGALAAVCAVFWLLEVGPPGTKRGGSIGRYPAISSAAVQFAALKA